MTDSEEHDNRTALKLWANGARVRSAAYAVQAARAAESSAVRRERAERIFDRTAERNPQYARPRRTTGGPAARSRTAIATSRHDRGAAGRPGGPLVPEPRTEPEAAVVSGLEVYLHNMATAKERDRMASELQDEVMRRLFAAGLTLHGAAGLTTQPGVRRRIEAAADELDEVIRLIRDATFNLPGAPAHHEPGGGQAPPGISTVA